MVNHFGAVVTVGDAFFDVSVFRACQAWLQVSGFEYAQNSFLEQEIDGQDLVDISDADLKSTFGLTNFKQRKRLPFPVLGWFRAWCPLAGVRGRVPVLSFGRVVPKNSVKC